MIKSIKKIINGDCDQILINSQNIDKPSIILSGSFNPFHKGHEELLKVAENLSGRNGMLELSIYNVDKSPIKEEEIINRILKIPKNYSIYLSNNSTFLEKAKCNPGSWFVIGYDTALRLFDKKYHSNVNMIFEEYKKLNIKFFVGGRNFNGSFATLKDLKIPKKFQKLFVEISEKSFRMDISSTDIRKKIN